MANSKNVKYFISWLVIITCLFLTLPLSFPGKIFAAGKTKVFIDAGHGGRDTGAIGFGFYEKDANIDIALRVKGKLEASGFSVVMSRTDDSNHTLDDIVNLANASKADMFVSIHNNAALTPYAHGTETYWCANGIAGSNQLASLIQSNIVNSIGRANRGVKTANFRVIKYTTMPGALVECTFITNQSENDLLRTKDFREKCANGIFAGIRKFAESINKLPDSSGGSSGNSGNNTNNDKDSPGFTMKVTLPKNNAKIFTAFEIRGWAADLKNTPAKKLAKIEIYKGPDRKKQNLLSKIESFETTVMSSEGAIKGGWKYTTGIDKFAEGENILYIYAFDEKGNYSVDNLKINVVKSGNTSEINLNPIAVPGASYKGNINKEVKFDGTKSYDPDGTIAEYSWVFGDGATSDIAKPKHIYTTKGTYKVTLTVKDSMGKTSSTVKTNVEIIDPADNTNNGNNTDGELKFGNVSNSTSFVGYIKISEDSLVKIFKDRSSSKVERASRLAKFYIKYGELFNLRADLAWSQMCHETGFLEFTGDVKPGQNNFAGMGATGGGVPGNSFASEELGVIAHFAHLSWYYFASDVNKYCNKTYDPRHFGNSHQNYTGDPSLGFINKRWAPSSSYTDKIILYANQIIKGMGNGTGSDIIKSEKIDAKAGDDKKVIIGETVSFDASESIILVFKDTKIEYSWDWNADGKYEDKVNTSVIKHVFEKSGKFEVVLKIKTSTGLESTDKVIVSVNSIPVADAGGPYEGFAGKRTKFDGSKSIDADGKIKKYLWDLGDGSTKSEAKPTHTYKKPGEYTVKLTVVDDKGVSSATVTTKAVITEKVAATDTGSSASTTVDTAANIIPVANAKGPYTGTTGVNITFDGSASSDPDGNIAEYQWDFGDGKTGGGIAPSHAYESPGEYMVNLTVVDDKGVSSAAVTTKAVITEKQADKNAATDTGSSASTTVDTAANVIPVANAKGPYTGTAGVNITFDGSASADSDGSIAEYQWDFGDGTAITNGKMPTHAYISAGTYTVKLKVKDNDGALSTETTATVIISGVVIQQQAPPNTTIITNTTSIIGYTEVSVDQLVSIFISRNSNKADWARRLAPLYIQYGKLFNIRAEIVWAQMCHETGFLEFTGDVKPGQNNFAGLGATGGVPGNSFVSEELGVIAHYAHLSWYYYPKHINQYCNSTYDQRHSDTHSRYTGDTTIGFLNGHWAPGSTYTSKILLFANQIYGN